MAILGMCKFIDNIRVLTGGLGRGLVLGVNRGGSY